MYNETNICMEFVSLMSRLTKLFYRYAVKFRTEILVMEDIFQLGEWIGSEYPHPLLSTWAKLLRLMLISFVFIVCIGEFVDKGEMLHNEKAL